MNSQEKLSISSSQPLPSSLYHLRTRDRLLFFIYATAIGLTVLIGCIRLIWGAGPVLAAVPWILPVVSSFIASTSLAIGFLALGRYQAIRTAYAYWISVGFITYSIGQAFYILSWPGLLPNGLSIIGHRTNTPAFISNFTLILFGLFLLGAVLIRWPGQLLSKGRPLIRDVAAWVILITVTFILVVSFEQYLPELVRADGTFTTQLKFLVGFVFLLFFTGSILTTRFYQRSRDTLAGYVTFAQIALVFVILMTLIGGRRYDLWWYLQRVVLATGLMVVLFGLLAEYRHLFRQIQDSETRYRTLTECLPQLIWTCTSDGMCNYLSPQWVAYTGLPEISQLGLGWVEQIHPDDRERALAAWKASQAAGEPYNFEYRIRGQGNRYRWFKALALPIRDNDGKIIQWFGSCTDIEDQKQAERGLREYTNRLERSNRDLQDFAFVASHDLQEPLRKIEAFSDAVLTETENPTPLQKEYLTRLQNSAARMRSMVNGLLQLSRLETHAQPFLPVDLKEVVSDVLSDLAEQIQRSQGNVVVCDLPVIEADSFQMRQLFQNLISNALKFQPPGGKPEIKVCANPLTSSFVEIWVEDNGIGFDETYSDHLFEPFKRLVGKTEYEGSGMGLAICRKIVERHGGEIFAKAERGQGATFLIHLPFTQNVLLALTEKGSKNDVPIAFTGRRGRSR